jgi:hypothetical protein
VCLLFPQSMQRHRPTACEKLRKLSLQHRQSVIAAKELCVYCLRHSDLEVVKTRECTKKNTRAHWLSSEARDPHMLPHVDRELPPVEPKAGRIPYACHTNIRIKTESDLIVQSCQRFSTRSSRCQSSPWMQPSGEGCSTGRY